MSQFTRAEHVRWAKDRALAELPNVANARASMVSDLGKHPATVGLVRLATITSLSLRDVRRTREWIEGFVA